MRRWTTVLCIGAMAMVPTSWGQAKKSLAIEPFDYSTVMSAVQAIFGTNQNVGQGIQAMMSKRVTQSGRFTVVERRKIGAVTKEQDFAQSNRVKQGTGPRTGQIRGADLSLLGDIVVFGRDDRSTGGRGAIGVGGVGIGAGGSKGEGKAVVVLNYRIVDNALVDGSAVTTWKSSTRFLPGASSAEASAPGTDW